MRTGNQTESYVTVLRNRLTSGVTDPIDALHLMPLKEQVEEYNENCLIELSNSSPVYEFEAEHSIIESTRQMPGVVSHQTVPASLIPSSDRDCAGLQCRVKLVIGAQAMLCRNIICEEGLVDGARGIIVVFSWPDSNTSQPHKGALPQNVYYVKFHDPRVGLISRMTINDRGSEPAQEAVPIEPITAKFYGKQGVTLQQKQLPLVPCWAATIHKVQGLSLDAAVINLGPKVFEHGMAYVALSRVRTLQGVALL